MSKHRSEATVDQVPVETPKPPAAIPISQCIGHTVICPQCGAPAHISQARGAFHVLSRCTGRCGARLEHIGVMAVVIEGAGLKAIIKPLGQAIGQTVRCPFVTDHSGRPSTVCGAPAKAEYDSVEKHGVRCREHNFVPYPSTMPVELWAE
jgi:hypothetical protein